MSSNQDFYLSQLDVDIDASSATFDGAVTVSFDASASAEVDVSFSVLRNLFQFSTDASDIDNLVATDILYKVDYTTQAEPLGIDLNTNTEVYEGFIQSGATDNHVAWDFVRYLALKLTNTYLGVDLFSNETELRDNLTSTFKTKFDAVLVGLAANPAVEADNNSPSESILRQIMNNEPSRLEHLENLTVEGTWHQTPIIDGDKLYFMLTVTSATGQEELTGVSAIPDRTYLIRINAVAD
jgi:hypothetical protein